MENVKRNAVRAGSDLDSFVVPALNIVHNAELIVLVASVYLVTIYFKISAIINAPKLSSMRRIKKAAKNVGLIA